MKDLGPSTAKASDKLGNASQSMSLAEGHLGNGHPGVQAPCRGRLPIPCSRRGMIWTRNGRNFWMNLTARCASRWLPICRKCWTGRKAFEVRPKQWCSV